MALIPLAELGVALAYQVLTGHFGVHGLPPLEAIEHEDWGPDYLLSRLHEMPAADLVAAGICADDFDAEQGRDSAPI
jgi:hypothetical protein